MVKMAKQIQPKREKMLTQAEYLKEVPLFILNGEDVDVSYARYVVSFKKENGITLNKKDERVAEEWAQAVKQPGHFDPKLSKNDSVIEKLIELIKERDRRTPKASKRQSVKAKVPGTFAQRVKKKGVVGDLEIK